ncbi:MAG TPA: hypothetical protein VLC71_10300 [Thermomonas sp.]|nr:hypothetical protein [Thermomonas sp.]
MSSIRGSLSILICLAIPGLAHAAGDACHGETLSATPVRPHLISPVAIELPPATTQLGGATGVLSQSFDEALSVDNVLMRIRLDGCRAMAKAAVPAGVAKPGDPAAYKPRTEFDNAPWRFDMTQNGKRMTADEFDAWMKARGVRVVGRKDAPAAETTAPAVPPAGDPKQ